MLTREQGKLHEESDPAVTPLGNPVSVILICVNVPVIGISERVFVAVLEPVSGFAMVMSPEFVIENALFS